MFTTLITSCLLATALLGGGKPKAPHKPTATQACTRPEPKEMVQVIYPVADLVVLVEDVVGENRGGLGIQFSPADRPGKAAVTGDCQHGQARKTPQESLIALICSTVAPQTWSDVGGPGSLRYYPLGMGLVVKNSREVQEQIADLLAALRRLQDLEVAIEIRLMTVPDRFYEDNIAGTQDSDAARPHADLPTRMTFLNDKQVRHLLETAQGDVRASTMQAPHFTVFNGHKASLDLTRKQFFVTDLKVIHQGDQVVVVPRNEPFETGLRFTVRPTVSADWRSVRMKLQASLTELESARVPLLPVTTQLVVKDNKEGREEVIPVRQFVQEPSFRTLKVAKSFSAGDGQTAVLHWGTYQEEGRVESGMPVLSQLPYLNRLFRTVGYVREARHVLLFVTPRIVINEEKEEVSLPAEVPVPKP